MKFALVLCVLLASAYAKVGFGPGDQEWDHVEVRDGAFMFWWIYFTTADVSSYTERPIIIWLQGGPGAASTGYGNFAELGPLDTDLNPRDYTWVKDANVMFIDNPVGTGFSYVTDSSKYTTDNRQIALDLVEMMRGFYKKLPEFKTVPLYITSESYGGKMAAEFALVLDQAVKEGTIESNFKGALLGDGWVSPIDSVMTWAPYLLHFGVVDVDGYTAVDKAAQKTKEYLEAGQFVAATNQWGATEGVIMQETDYVDFYNILKKISYFKYKNKPFYYRLIKPAPRDEDDDKIEKIMPQVAEKLGISHRFDSQSGTVFSRLSGDFMKANTHIVEELLNSTSVKCFVINGQLDLIVDTPGTVKWVDALQWKGKDGYVNKRRQSMVVDGVIEGYEKTYSTFGMFWVNRAGHMVPADNPSAMDYILRKLTDDYSG